MTSNATKASPGAPPAWRLRLLLRPPVVIELLVGISPLAGIAFWGWDTFLILMLHLLALALSAAWLVVRVATLSGESLRYFSSTPGRPAARGARWLYAGFALFTLGAPLVLFVAFITVELRAPEHGPIRGVIEFWRVVVVASGLWLPLAFVAACETLSFVADVVLPRLSLARRFQAPRRPINKAYASLSGELQAFLYVRAFVVLRMIVTVLGVGIGLFLAQGLGAIAPAVILVVLKTAVAVLLEFSAGIDIDKRAPGWAKLR
jgi:hypothetical protein